MVSNKKSNLSILVPALNEEADLEDTFMCICDATQIDQSIQIILVNDGSSDSTGEIVDRLSDYRTESINVSSVHNEFPIGLGAVYELGVKFAKYEHFMWLPADNGFPTNSLKRLFKEIGTSDLLIPHHTNAFVARPLLRCVISWVFTNLLNIFAGTNLKYFNGTVVHRTELLRSVGSIRSDFAFSAEIILQFLARGHSYKEIGIEINKEKLRGSRAFNVANFVGVSKFLIFVLLRRLGEVPK